MPKKQKIEYEYSLTIYVAPGTVRRAGYASRPGSLDEVAKDIADAIEDSQADSVKSFKIVEASEL